MKKLEEFECEDRYEAEKLAGLVAPQKDNSSYIAGVATVIKNEIVIILKDKSSHSVILKDNNAARRLKLLLEDVTEGKKRISNSTFKYCTTEIGLAEV
jgi:hypothetical protein